MGDTDQTTTTPSVLGDKLRANELERGERAAVELLIWHETWINRLAYGLGDGRFVTADEDVARINWLRVSDHLDEPNSYSSNEVRVFRVAASLAANTGVGLREVLGDASGPATRRAMLAAITAAAGDVAPVDELDAEGV